MDLDAIKDSPIGELVPMSMDDARTGDRIEHVAFMPAPLPSAVDLATETWQSVVQATEALSKLDQGGRQIPAPELLRRPAIRREAQSTSALEGTYAAFTDLLEADLDEAAQPRSVAITELLNYVRTAEEAFDWILDREVTLGFLGGLQERLVRDTPGHLSDAGRIRDQQVVVGSPGSAVADARYVPPPPGDRLRGGVEAWLDWVNADSETPPVIRAALAHYQFEALHPFSDGNGRIGRLLVVLQLMQYKVLRDPLLVVSPWFEARRREYQDHLLRVSQTGDYNGWVAFFSEGLRAQAVTTIERVNDLLEYQEHMRRRIRDQGIRGIAGRIAEDLIGNPMVSPTWAANYYGVSYQAANNGIRRLSDEGILIEATGRRYGRVFSSPEVLQIIQG